MSVIRVGDRVEHIDPFQAEMYYGTVEEFWVIYEGGPPRCRLRVLRDVDDPTSWWACDPEYIKKVENLKVGDAVQTKDVFFRADFKGRILSIWKDSSGKEKATVKRFDPPDNLMFKQVTYTYDLDRLEEIDDFRRSKRKMGEQA